MGDNKLKLEEWKDAPDFGPYITDEQVGEFEDHAGGNNIGTWRRVMFVLLARDRETSVKFATEETEAFIEMSEGITAFREHLVGLLELAKIAEARVNCAAGVAMYRLESGSNAA